MPLDEKTAVHVLDTNDPCCCTDVVVCRKPKGTVAISEGAAVISNGTCHSSYDCGHGMCCRSGRSGSGHVITNQQLGGFGPHMGGVHQTGSCVVSPAAKGERCDARCECGAGLACYRPMSGVCCPQMTCRDEDYVKKQREYWANCFKDPHCAFPQ